MNDVLVVEPDNENVIFSLGIIQYGYNNLQKALELFNKTLQLNASHQGALYNFGFTCMRLQKYPDAMPVLTRLITLYPMHVNGLTQLGTCYVHLHQYDRAVGLYEMALKVDSRHALTLFNLGRFVHKVMCVSYK